MIYERDGLFWSEKFHEVKSLGFQGIPSFISSFDEHLADRFIFP